VKDGQHLFIIRVDRDQVVGLLIGTSQMASEAMQMSLTAKTGRHRQMGGLHVAV